MLMDPPAYNDCMAASILPCTPFRCKGAQSNECCTLSSANLGLAQRLQALEIHEGCEQGLLLELGTVDEMTQGEELIKLMFCGHAGAEPGLTWGSEPAVLSFVKERSLSWNPAATAPPANR